MYFYPRNKYLLISYIAKNSEAKAETAVIFPPGYLGQEESLKVVVLKKAPDDSLFVKDQGKNIAVQSHLIEQIKYNGETFSIVPESAVYGVIIDETPERVV